MTTKTASVGINKWAGEMPIREIVRSGYGDNLIIAWARSDGATALETNGDPVFGQDAVDWVNDAASDQVDREIPMPAGITEDEKDEVRSNRDRRFMEITR